MRDLSMLPAEVPAPLCCSWQQGQLQGTTHPTGNLQGWGWGQVAAGQGSRSPIPETARGPHGAVLRP